MSGLGGRNKSPNGVVLGMVQLQLPVVDTPQQLARQTERIVAMVGKARRNLAGMDLVVFPEMAREAAYKGAEIMLRTAGYTAPIRHSWKITNQANAFSNLMVTASVCMCGSDGSFDSMGEGMIVNFDGTAIVEGGGRPDEIISAEVRPDLVREARRGWGVENNIYQLGHRGFVAVRGGARDCPYTFMQDMVAGRYQLPWENEVQVTDGSSCGFAAPTRDYAPQPSTAAKKYA